MANELATDGFQVGVGCIKRLRWQLGLRCKQKRKFKATTSNAVSWFEASDSHISLGGRLITGRHTRWPGLKIYTPAKSSAMRWAHDDESAGGPSAVWRGVTAPATPRINSP